MNALRVTTMPFLEGCFKAIANPIAAVSVKAERRDLIQFSSSAAPERSAMAKAAAEAEQAARRSGEGT